MTSFMSEKGRKPTRSDFYNLFVPAYEGGASMKNISGFKKRGIYPFDNNALPDDTYRVGILHDVENNGSDQENVLPKPQPLQNARVRQSAAQKSRVIDSLLPSSSSATASSSASVRSTIIIIIIRNGGIIRSSSIIIIRSSIITTTIATTEVGGRR